MTPYNLEDPEYSNISLAIQFSKKKAKQTLESKNQASAMNLKDSEGDKGNGKRRLDGTLSLSGIE